MPTSQHLRERDREVRELRRLIRSALSGHGGALVVEGPAGIGKTELVAFAQSHARRSGMAVVSARGDQLERDFPFGIARELFEPAAAPGERHRNELLIGSAAPVKALFDDARSEPEQLPGQGDYALLRGLYRLTENLARRAPLLVTVDDAHYSDGDSLRWILYLVRRLDALRAAVVVAVRTSGAAAQRPLLERLQAEPGVAVLRPRRLSTEAVAAMVEERFGTGASREFAEALHQLAGGNPFLVREVLDAAREATSEEASRLRTVGLPGVVQSVRFRLEQVPGAAVALAQALAVLGDGASLAEAAELAGLEREAAVTAADTLAEIELIEDRPRLRFAQPVVRSAIHAALPAAQRGARHADAARVIASKGAPPEDVGTQLLAADPRGDRWASEALRDAANTALARGAPDAAAAYLQRALEEPPPESLRNELAFELGNANAQIAAEPALDQLRLAHSEARGGRERAQRALRFGRALAMADNARESVEVMSDALAAVDGTMPELRLLLESDVVAVARITPGVPQMAAKHLRQLTRIARPGTDGERAVLCHRAFDAALTGSPAGEVSELARRALSGGPLLDPEPNPLAFAGGVHALCLAGQFEFARSALESAAKDATARGSVVERALVCLLQARLANARGSVEDAEHLATEAVDLARSHGWRLLLPLGVASLVEAHLARGDLAAAEAAVAPEHAPDPVPAATFAHSLLASRGRLRLQQGRPAEALGELLAAGASLHAFSASNPAVCPWRSQAAEAYVRLGRMAEARELAEEELELAGRFGAAPALGVALRGLALVETGARSRSLLAESASVLEHSAARLEYAQTLTELGAAERRAGQRVDAREPLRRAVDIADACGAVAVAQRATAELMATGARPRRAALSGPPSLTPSERRVAELAATGATNRQIAAALVITTKTVETHLGHVYRKLEVGHRDEIAAALDSAAPFEVP